MQLRLQHTIKWWGAAHAVQQERALQAAAHRQLNWRACLDHGVGDLLIGQCTCIVCKSNCEVLGLVGGHQCLERGGLRGRMLGVGIHVSSLICFRTRYNIVTQVKLCNAAEFLQSGTRAQSCLLAFIPAYVCVGPSSAAASWWAMHACGYSLCVLVVHVFCFVLFHLLRACRLCPCPASICIRRAMPVTYLTGSVLCSGHACMLCI
jgi:hypothetical protein